MGVGVGRLYFPEDLGADPLQEAAHPEACLGVLGHSGQTLWVDPAGMELEGLEPITPGCETCWTSVQDGLEVCGLGWVSCSLQSGKCCLWELPAQLNLSCKMTEIRSPPRRNPRMYFLSTSWTH